MNNQQLGDGLQIDRLGCYLAIGAAAALITGSLLPWVTVTAPIVGELSRSGTTAGDGVITLIAGIGVGLAAAVYLAGQQTWWLGIPVLLAALVAAFVGVVDFVDITNRLGEVEQEAVESPLGELSIEASRGTGLYVVIAGAALAAIAGGFIMGPRRTIAVRNTATPPTTPPTEEA